MYPTKLLEIIDSTRDTFTENTFRISKNVLQQHDRELTLV